jgi:pimeloyl-ACP methyl ester carboxylesterase
VIGAAVQLGVASVDGFNIVYESGGTGAPPVVFIHGILGDRTYFAGQMEHLAPRHRVLGLDLRGHGESDVPATVSVEDFERDVVAVLEAARIEPAVLCGHSMAGGVALAVAAARPDLVCGVVMLDGVIFFPAATRQAAIDGLLPALDGDRWLDALRGYLGRLIEPASPLVVARVMGDLGRARREIAVSFFASVYGSDYAPRQERYADALSSIGCPLMYVRAKSPADLQQLTTRKPDAMIGQVVGSGHYVMLSAADQLNAMLDRFLAAVAQRP